MTTPTSTCTSARDAALAQQLEREGFAIVPSSLPCATLEALRAVLSGVQAPDERGLYARRDVLSIALVRELCAGGLGQVAREVLGPKARAVRGIFFDKVPSANWKVPWHQDLSIAVRQKHEAQGFGPWSIKDGVPHVQPPAQVLEAMLTLRLHLDPCPKENGALRVLPGSHLSGRLSPVEIQAWRERVEERVCEVEHGGILLMKPLLLHASSASTVPLHRRVLHIEWAAEALSAPLRWFYE